MFESIEIRKVENGIIVSVKTEDEDKDYVFPNVPKTLKFVKEYLETKQPA
jgi:uncharacterized Fe-S cluster-containing protein